MKNYLGSAAIAACILTPFGTLPANATQTSEPITVGCFRGPFKSVIWDHPKQAFVDSLMANGFSYDRATEIGERVCRDERLVGQPEQLAEQTRRLIRQTPRK